MALFTIICKSCTARLGISQVTAIGQLLACPKCGTMIEVQPPQDWQPADEADTAELTTPPKIGQAGTDSHFDDIDHILDSDERQRQAIKQTRKHPHQQPAARVSVHSNQTKSSSQAILPNADWTSNTVRHRKRLISIIAVVIGSLFIGIAIVAALMNSGDSNNKKIADNVPLDPKQDQASEKAEPLPDTAPPDSVPDPTDPTTQDQITDEKKTDETKSQQPDPPIDPTSESKPVSPLNNQNHEPMVPLPIDPQSNPITPSANPSLSELDDLETFQSELGELSVLLEASGSSVQELSDLATTTHSQQQIGTPKYFIPKPDPVKIQLEKQLSQTCHGVQYTNVKLADVIQDISTITGIPISFDPVSIQAVGASANQKISLDLEDTDFSTLLDTILTPLSLAKTVTASSGLKIEAANIHQKVTKIHTAPRLPETGADSQQQFLNTIQSLISPTSWMEENDPATITWKGDQITVYNTVLAQHKIADLITKIQSAIDLTKDFGNGAAQELIATRWSNIFEKIHQPVGLPATIDLPISSWIARISQKTDVTILIDWDSLLFEGWTLQTVIPGYIDEDNLEATLQQVARSMNLTFLAIDETTLELTTFQTAARMNELEVYHFGRLLTGPINEQLALRLINESLGSQLHSPSIRILYEHDCQCLVVLAPQSIQRQIQTIVRRIEDLKRQ